MIDTGNLQKISTQVRRDIMRMTHGSQSGHPGGSLGCTDFLVNLYFAQMKHTPSNFTIDGTNEDLFFLSNGHISPAWYSVLARCGYFNVSELGSFRKLGTRLQGHPTTHEGLPGVRVASGSLGQGLSVAIGAALTKKLKAENNTVYCLMGDGEIQEGQVWEAAMFAAGNKVDNLIGFIDVNGQQIDGPVEKVLPEGDLRAKWTSFGWDVLDMDGHDHDTIHKVISEAKSRIGKGKPVMVLMKTVMGKGVDFMEGTHKWHGVAPNDEQLSKGLAQLQPVLGDY